MEVISGFFGNFVVQVLLGVGAMIFLIMLGESVRSMVHRHNERLSSKAEEQLRSEFAAEISHLREQMSSLQGTLLEHSMSLDNNVEGLKHKVSALEQRQRTGVEHA